MFHETVPPGPVTQAMATIFARRGTYGPNHRRAGPIVVVDKRHPDCQVEQRRATKRQNVNGERDYFDEL